MSNSILSRLSRVTPEKLKQRATRLLAEDPFARRAIFHGRRIYYCHVKRQLQSTSSEHAFEATVSHNFAGVAGAGDRMLRLIRPLSIIESLPRNARVLVIGPRNEYDLMLLLANGFEWSNIEGVDLISYSPKIKLADMHSMPYADDTWDAVLCGWTLSYSHNPKKAAEEIVRVTKKNGLIGIGVDYSTLTAEQSKALFGYSIEDRGLLAERINSVEQILSLFSPHVDQVFFQHDAPNKVSYTEAPGVASPTSFAAAIFSSKK